MDRVYLKVGSVIYQVRVKDKIRKVHIKQMRKSHFNYFFYPLKVFNTCKDLCFSEYILIRKMLQKIMMLMVQS